MSAPVRADSIWTIGGRPPQADQAPPDAVAYASWSGSDHNTGVIRFGPFHAQDGAIAVKLITGPSQFRQSIVLTDASTGEVLSAFEPGRYDSWTWVRLTMPPSTPGRALMLQALDQGNGWGQWMGVSIPYAIASKTPLAR